MPVGDDARSTADLASLVDRYSRLLFRVAYAVLRSRSEAEEVVQDVFVRVLQYRGPLHAILDMRVWLTRIAWNLAIDRRRRVRPQQMDAEFAATLVSGGRAADEAFDEAEQMQRVMRELDRLPRAERQALLLSAVDELETPALAAVLGRSESAVRALLFRARTRLRERLERGGAR